MASDPAAPLHGGRLREAARCFGIPLSDWLDLSTGINPVPYPVPPVPDDIWQRLPEEHDGLEAAAANYYGSSALLPVAGSQAAIQALPLVVPGERITLLTPAYAEHAHAWRHKKCCYLHDAGQIESMLPQTDVLLLVNPNNPTATRFSPACLLNWLKRLSEHGGWLIVDEAFVDTLPELSLLRHAGERDNLVVLRSPGKFFGLAGARVGFVFAPEALRLALAQHLGPWALSGPARYAARIALSNTAWQQETLKRLLIDGKRLAALLHDSRLGETAGTPLFQWLVTPHADALYHHFARQGILVRKFDIPPSLRFGLPANEAGWQRLQSALADSATLR